jgi:3-oxoadipate enol-lactonase
MLSHSLATDHTFWEPQIDALVKAGWRVLAYDTRGHGTSACPPGPWSLDDLADDALALLDEVGAAQVHFVGLSMGGMIGQHLALKAPQRLASLVLSCTSSAYPSGARALWDERIALVRSQGMQAAVAGTLERWFTAGYRERHPGLMARIAQMIRRTPVEGYAGCAHAIVNLNTTERLGAIRSPVLVISAEADPGTPPAMHDIIEAAIPGAKRARLSGAHLCNIESADAYNQALTDFLNSLR